MKRIDQLKAQREALDKRIKELASKDQRAERKLDERRKVILGGWLIKHRPDLVKNIVLNGLERPQDKAAFEGWITPEPEKENNGNLDTKSENINPVV